MGLCAYGWPYERELDRDEPRSSQSTLSKGCCSIPPAMLEAIRELARETRDESSPGDDWQKFRTVVPPASMPVIKPAGPPQPIDPKNPPCETCVIELEGEPTAAWCQVFSGITQNQRIRPPRISRLGGDHEVEFDVCPGETLQEHLDEINHRSREANKTP